jgi:hypothetical protein
VRQQVEEVGRDEMAELMSAVESLSDEEVAALLAEERESEEAAGD